MATLDRSPWSTRAESNAGARLPRVTRRSSAIVSFQIGCRTVARYERRVRVGARGFDPCLPPTSREADRQLFEAPSPDPHKEFQILVVPYSQANISADPLKDEHELIEAQLVFHWLLHFGAKRHAEPSVSLSLALDRCSARCRSRTGRRRDGLASQPDSKTCRPRCPAADGDRMGAIPAKAQCNAAGESRGVCQRVAGAPAHDPPGPAENISKASSAGIGARAYSAQGPSRFTLSRNASNCCGSS